MTVKKNPYASSLEAIAEQYEEVLSIHDDVRQIERVSTEAINESEACFGAIEPLSAIAASLESIESLSLREAILTADNLDIALINTGLEAADVYPAISEDIGKSPKGSASDFLKSLLKKIIEALKKFWEASKSLFTQLTSFYDSASDALDKQADLLKQLIADKKTPVDRIKAGKEAYDLSHLVGRNGEVVPAASAKVVIDSLDRLKTVNDIFVNKFLPSIIRAGSSLRGTFEDVAKDKLEKDGFIEEGTGALKTIEYKALASLAADKLTKLPGYDLREMDAFMSPILPGGSVILLTHDKSDEPFVRAISSRLKFVHFKQGSRVTDVDTFSDNDIRKIIDETKSVLSLAKHFVLRNYLPSFRNNAMALERISSHYFESDASDQARIMLQILRTVTVSTFPIFHGMTSLNRRTIKASLTLTNHMLKAYTA